MSWLCRFAAANALVIAAAGLSASGARAEKPCDNGALVPPDKCSFFYYFRKDDAYLTKDGAHPDDVHVKVLLHHLGAKEGDHIRSMALIAGISNYPNLPRGEQSLQAAKIDVDQLEVFLKDQKFDEIIVLRDGDVTLDNLRYFLRTYALWQADYYKRKVRFVFAYSGHGADVERTSTKGLLLSQATSTEDLDNVIGLNELQPYFNDLARNTFHFLALINSCYGGAIFTVGLQGDDRNNTYGEGAYAITAGPKDKEVYSIGAGHGSVFFQSLIQGVTTGDADDRDKFDGSMAWGDPGSSMGTISLNSLDRYLAWVMSKLTDPETHKPYADEKVGSVDPVDTPAPSGAFFFLQPAYAAPPLRHYPAARNGGGGNGPNEWFSDDEGNGGGAAGSGGPVPAGTPAAGTSGAFWNGVLEQLKRAEGGVQSFAVGPPGVTQLGLNYGASGQFHWGSDRSASGADTWKRAADAGIQTLAVGPSLTTQFNYGARQHFDYSSDSSVAVAEAFPSIGKPVGADSSVQDWETGGSNGTSNSGGFNPTLPAAHPTIVVPQIGQAPHLDWTDVWSGGFQSGPLQDQSPIGRYAIHGIDLSDRPDKVDWKKVASGDVKFAFLKATQSASFVDPSFAGNWDQSKAANVPRGAYHTFSFCDSPEAQYDLIASVVPVDPSALPIAVDAELFDGQDNSNIDYLARQGACAGRLGPEGIAKNLKELLDDLRKRYGKKPVLYGNTEFVNRLKDKLTGAASIWIADYSAASRTTFAPRAGDLWQFTDAASVPGVGGLTDLSVFAGTPDEFQKFANGE